MQRLTPSDRIALGAQTVCAELAGAHTGAVSLPMLESVGCSFVILGHSERRAAGTTDEAINASLLAALKRKVTAVLCVGELERDDAGTYFNAVEDQLKADLANVPKAKLKDVVIAYEPVWAIGTGVQPTPEDVHEMKLFIQKIIAAQFGRVAIPKARIIYGGSVKPTNAAVLLEDGEVDGFLIGGASLIAKDFLEIIKLAVTYAKQRA